MPPQCINKPLAEMLDRRAGLGIASIARLIFTGRSALSQVLSGQRIGRQTWPKLARVLTKEEYDCARQFAAKNLAEDWLKENPGSRAEEVARFALSQKTARGLEVMRLPKDSEELRVWLDQQYKTPSIT